MAAARETVATSAGPAPIPWISRAADGLIASWIVTARVVCIAAGFGLVGYLVLRPFLPALGGGADSAAFAWSELRTWPALMANTLAVVTVATAVNLLVGLPLGFLLFRTDLPGRRGLLWLLVLPACLPAFVTATGVLAWVGVRPWDGNPWMVGAIHGWLGLPWAALLMGLAYQHVDGALEESAALDAAWWWVSFAFDLPLVLWGILSVVLLQTWIAGTEVAVSDLLAVRTFAEEVYATFQLNRSMRAQSLVVVPYVILFVFVLFVVMRTAHSADASLVRFDDRSPPTIRLGRWRWPLWLGTVGLMAALVAAPVWRLLKEARGLTDFMREAGGLRGEVADTSLMAVGAAALLLLLVCGAGEWALAKGTGGRGLRISLVLLLATPTPCLAIALKEIMNRPGLLGRVHDSAGLPMLGQAVRWLPLIVLAAAPGWVLVSRDMHDAARTDGCGLAELHRRLYWPVAARNLSIATFAAAVFIFGELTVSVLLSPPGFLPLSVRFFTLAHYGIQGKPAVVCLLTMLVMVIPWGILVYLLNRTTEARTAFGSEQNSRKKTQKAQNRNV